MSWSSYFVEDLIENKEEVGSFQVSQKERLSITHHNQVLLWISFLQSSKKGFLSPSLWPINKHAWILSWLRHSLLFFVNTNKMRNYSYIKGRSQCPFTSHETLQNNFSFHSNKGIHYMHYIWYGGEPLACPLHIPHNNHVFYHNRASETPDFLSELTEE